MFRFLILKDMAVVLMANARVCKLQAIKVILNLVDSHKPIQVLYVYMYIKCMCAFCSHLACVTSKFKVSIGV